MEVKKRKHICKLRAIFKTYMSINGPGIKVNLKAYVFI